MAVVVAALGAAAAGADWLVIRGGHGIQTDGAWRVEGALVVFTTPGGTLAAVRLDEVDLEASRELTETAQRAETEAEAESSGDETTEDSGGGSVETPRRKATFILTDADVGHVNPGEHRGGAAADRNGNAGGLEASESNGNRRSESGPLEVIGWNQAFDPSVSGVAVTGTLRNDGELVSVGVTVAVTVFDDGGAELATKSALVGNRVLRPGESTPFKAVFPGVTGEVRPVFEADGFHAQPGAQPGNGTQGG